MFAFYLIDGIYSFLFIFFILLFILVLNYLSDISSISECCTQWQSCRLCFKNHLSVGLQKGLFWGYYFLGKQIELFLVDLKFTITPISIYFVYLFWILSCFYFRFLLKRGFFNGGSFLFSLSIYHFAPISVRSCCFSLWNINKYSQANL